MERGITDLALFGGTPVFKEDRRVGRPNPGLRDRFLERMNTVLDNEWLTNMGPLMNEFEQRVAEAAGVRHAISVCNATVGLQLLAGETHTGEAEAGDEVIVPALTFIATGHAVRWRGLRPVFCDVDPVTGLIDPDQVEALITPRTRAIIGVHLWGQPCDVDRLEKIAASNRLRLYFDAAPAFGCTYGDEPIGRFGDAAVFSFHATKIVNSFEGGAVVTDDDALAERVRASRNFGTGPDGTIETSGTNGKLNEAAAAMGLTSLEALDENIACNRANFLTYVEALADVPGVTVQEFDSRHRNNHHYMMVTVSEEEAGLHRDALLDVLRAENILAQPYFAQALHQMTPYRGSTPVSLPGAEGLCERLLALPTGAAVSAEDVRTISDVIRTAVANGPGITARRKSELAAAGGE